MIKKPGESLADSFLEEGFVLDKSFGIGQPRKIENAKILIANTPMDTDKIKIYGSRVRLLENHAVLSYTFLKSYVFSLCWCYFYTKIIIGRIIGSCRLYGQSS